MKKVILLALLMPVPAFGQIADNFEKENIVNWTESTAGHWKADSTENLSGKFSLHHIFNNPDAGTDQIGIPEKNLHPSDGNTRWSFRLKYGSDPSAQNNWAVFIMSDAGPAGMSPDGATHGFAFGVDLNGSDDTLRLWKVNGSQISTVITCPINWQTDIGTDTVTDVIIERSVVGEWSVTVSDINGSLIGTGSGTDNELFDIEWFGILYRYTATRDMLLWIDDITVDGVFINDTEAPSITSCVPYGKKSVEITFSEQPFDSIMIPENFSLDEGEKGVKSVVKINNLVYQIEFSEEFINRTQNNLIIKRICDKSGNCSQNVSISFTTVWAERGDVIISEIMADPTPEVSLPGKEYLELTNRTGNSLNLKNWRLCTESQTAYLPESEIGPSESVILCALQDTLLYKEFGKVAGVKQFPALTDGGRLLYIADSTGYLIHGVDYSSSWYKDDLKSSGGWSLEMKDTGFPFYDSDNWQASTSKNGGTPGKANSVSISNPDNNFYGIKNVFAVDSANVIIWFSEPLFDLEKNIMNVKIGENKISELSSLDPLSRKYSAKLVDPLHKNKMYHLEISGDNSDFAGNSMQKTIFDFGLAEPAATGDILFNEILFNPWPGDPDYLEFYNSSEKIIDASRLQLVSVNAETGEEAEPLPVSKDEYCILPGEYYAITTDSKKISERYFSGNAEHLFDIGSLPSMPDDKGHLILFNRELDKIDELTYNDKMQFALLSTNEGVALEKITPGGKSDLPANWHSAAESAGWGTPGAPNSLFSEMPATNDEVALSSTKISPDGDGNEDFLTVKMNLKGNGNVVSITVFDETGNYVRKLASNLMAGNQATVLWDGTEADGSMVRSGIYIIFITLYDDTGKTKQWKKVCTVIR